jgi:hypothetical protein
MAALYDEDAEVSRRQGWSGSSPCPLRSDAATLRLIECERCGCVMPGAIVTNIAEYVIHLCKCTKDKPICIPTCESL